MNQSAIEIFKTEDGATGINVILDNDTVWLNLNQISTLFERDKSVISRHIRNIFKEQELENISTVANFATVQIEGEREVERNIEYFNLDIIISVGYRINSKRGTQFRIWANKVLKEYLIRGYALNERKLQQQNEQLKELQESVKILGNVLKEKKLTNSEKNGLLEIISNYAYALDILDQYDYQSLQLNSISESNVFRLTYDEAITQIELARKYYGNSSLFGNEKDDSFKSSITTIYQTFDGLDLYPSVEEKAANLLYFITKNHSFTDGNKRIAAFLFLYFMEKTVFYTTKMDLKE
jgi:prophage antirepressor-like protein